MSVPIARTGLTESEMLSVLEPLRSGWLVQGPKVREFEQAWCAFTGAENSIAVTSCTTALHLSLAALGFGPGDEAIVPAFTLDLHGQCGGALGRQGGVRRHQLGEFQH